MRTAVYTSRQAFHISGISLRQLAYWRKSGFLVPSQCTPGGHSRYTFNDLIALKSARQLLDAGVSLQKIRKSMHALRRFLPTLRSPLTEIALVATGDVILILHEGSAFEALSGQQWIFPVARMAREIQQFHDREQAGAMEQGELFPGLRTAQPSIYSAK